MNKLSEAGLLHYFSLETCQQMWYWEATKMFWRAGYRLFHGKFLSFMSCPRGIGTFVNNSSSSRKLNPELTDINFEVPSRTSILDQNNNLVPNVIHPGVINESLDAVKSISNINMMCVDGKKVTAGLDEDFGDVNVFGFGDRYCFLKLIGNIIFVYNRLSLVFWTFICMQLFSACSR